MQAHIIWPSQMLSGQKPVLLLTYASELPLTLILGSLTSCQIYGTFNNTLPIFHLAIVVV